MGELFHRAFERKRRLDKDMKLSKKGSITEAELLILKEKVDENLDKLTLQFGTKRGK